MTEERKLLRIEFDNEHDVWAVIFVFEDSSVEGGEDSVIESMPQRWEICLECDGDGKVCNPSIGAITADEWHNGWSDDEKDFYMRGGYDVKCPGCNGTGKVREVDVGKLTPEVRAAWEKHLHEEAQFRSIQRSERMMEDRFLGY